ncbi:hypothetical protein Pyn_10177 [Prunus yedoensis var. nudiflora]|uniref:Uncharacterized protein n=1 Tax=Prunus yedoensis var. nudiflora TaxID=2094558 RepID=A0A314YVS2_PRUYE|nr:hypothetical protein Pyn_10177 [Prunus yedoensis var. nudiflora]
MLWRDPLTLSVVRMTTFVPRIEVAKLIISSADAFVLPPLEALSHSRKASNMIFSMVELSGTSKIRFCS